MGFESAIADWERVGRVDPKKLTEARLVAHWAVQVVAGVGEALVPAEPDFSHTSLDWLGDDRLLAGQPTPKGVRVALRLGDMTLHVRIDGETVASLELTGKTLAGAVAWVTGELEKKHGSLRAKPAIPTHEMPAHPVGRGSPFAAPDRDALEELTRYYANAWRFESVMSGKTLGASPVRCWPHHFDIATLVTLDPPGTNPEEARSIGLGLSPGDAIYDEPYFYVNPWPFPEDREGCPELGGGGHWRTEGWFGAVLPASAVDGGSATDQARQVFAFITSAFAAERSILEAL
jgi:hypothetical protein